jgi:hypothetical protein
MNLLQIRTKFRELSGRFDLVSDTYADLGADFFINEGSKHLDRLHETQKSWGTSYKFLEVGKWAVSFPYCRAIKEVWVASTTARWQLEKKRLQDLLEGYINALNDSYLPGPPSACTPGTPLYYSPCITRHIPENASAADLEAFIGYVDIPAGNAHEFNSILVNVPTDTKLTVMINGLFYSMELVNDTDENYWSAVHPMLLISSAMRMTEIVNRNTQGVNDWDNTINIASQQLGFDLVEEMIAEVDDMEG